jgi:ABC-type spermidine/putrescine transport system permease subunit II
MRLYFCGQLFTWACAAVWFLVIVLPVGSLFLSMRVADIPGPDVLSAGRYGWLVGRSLMFGGLVAGVSVLAGWSAGTLWTLSTLVPVGLLAGHVGGWGTFVRFGLVSWEGLASSGAIAAGAAAVAMMIAAGVLLQSRYGWSALAGVMRWSTMVVMLLPGSLVGVAMVTAFNRGVWAEAIYNRFWMVSIGHGSQLAVLPVILMSWVRASLPRELRDLARLDGATGLRGLITIYLPGLWPAVAAGAILTGTLSMTELPAMLVLLPAGVPNFAQQLLNQMHYARDEAVIASSLLMILMSGEVAGAVFGCVRLAERKETPQRAQRSRRGKF